MIPHDIKFIRTNEKKYLSIDYIMRMNSKGDTNTFVITCLYSIPNRNTK